jgi:hypothetical protein
MMENFWWNEEWQGKPKYSEKTCPSSTLPTTNPTCQIRARTRAAAMGSQPLTASALARPILEITVNDLLDKRQLTSNFLETKVLLCNVNEDFHTFLLSNINQIPFIHPQQDGRELTHFYRSYMQKNYILLYVVIVTYDTT